MINSISYNNSNPKFGAKLGWRANYELKHAPEKLAKVAQNLKEMGEPTTVIDIMSQDTKKGRMYSLRLFNEIFGEEYNISLLKEAGVEIITEKNGSYIDVREFEDAELHMLIDGVLSSKYITAAHSKDLIERLCQLSNKYFKASVKYIYSVNDWSKTDNQQLFRNIEIVSDAI